MIRAASASAIRRSRTTPTPITIPVRANNFYTNVGDGYATALLPNGQPATFQQGFPLPVPVSIPSNGILPAIGSQLLSQSDVHHQPELQESLRGDLEHRGAASAAGALGLWMWPTWVCTAWIRWRNGT